MARFSIYMPNHVHRRMKAELPTDESASGLATLAVEATLAVGATRVREVLAGLISEGKGPGGSDTPGEGEP